MNRNGNKKYCKEIVQGGGGDDGGTERSDSGATPFRTLDLGGRLGTMVVPERSGSGATPSEYST